MPKVRTQPCPECGGEMRYEKRADRISYRGHEKTIQALAWWCKNCGESILAGKPLLARERAFQALKADVDGVLGPEEVAKVRKALGLSQRRAGELLGGGPRAFQKYEAGAQTPSVPMSHLLTLLARDPRRLSELEERASSTVQAAAKKPASKARPAVTARRQSTARRTG
jgi:HTH-type transcriptional regulator / antitoxin MqsA